jgi:hypothetical protein
MMVILIVYFHRLYIYACPLIFPCVFYTCLLTVRLASAQQAALSYLVKHSGQLLADVQAAMVIAFQFR